MSWPRASVVVATRNRSASLERLLDALWRQTVPRSEFEVVCVDDASADETREVLERHAFVWNGSLRVLHRTEAAGPAAARNVGWRSAAAPVIAFTDDDCVPEAGWLAAALGVIATERCGIVMGATHPLGSGPNEPFSRTMAVDHEDGRYPTCNVFYLREALERVGGFDEGFHHACGEDTDLAWRVKAAGFRSGFCAEARVGHTVRPPDFGLFLRERRRFADQILLVKRHPELRRLFYRRYFYRRSHLHVLASAVVALAASLVGWGILSLLPLIWLDRFRRVDFGSGRASKVQTAAQLAIADVWEFLVFCYWSVRYRAILI